MLRVPHKESTNHVDVAEFEQLFCVEFCIANI